MKWKVLAGSFVLCLLILAVPAIAQETVNVTTSKSLTDALLAQGPIGIVCVILIGASLLIYRDARSDKKDYNKAIEEHAKALALKDEKFLALSLEYAKDRSQSTSAVERFLRYIERIENKQ